MRNTGRCEAHYPPTSWSNSCKKQHTTAIHRSRWHPFPAVFSTFTVISMRKQMIWKHKSDRKQKNANISSDPMGVLSKSRKYTQIVSLATHTLALNLGGNGWSPPKSKCAQCITRTHTYFKSRLVLYVEALILLFTPGG